MCCVQRRRTRSGPGRLTASSGSGLGEHSPRARVSPGRMLETRGMRLVYFSRDYTAHDLRFVRAVAHLRLENDGIPYVREPLPSGCRWLEWAGGRGRLGGVADLMALEQKCAEAIERVEPDLVHAGPIQSCGLLAALAGKAPTLLMSWGSDVLVDADRDE